MPEIHFVGNKALQADFTHKKEFGVRRFRHSSGIYQCVTPVGSLSLLEFVLSLLLVIITVMT